MTSTCHPLPWACFGIFSNSVSVGHHNFSCGSWGSEWLINLQSFKDNVSSLGSNPKCSQCPFCYFMLLFSNWRGYRSFILSPVPSHSVCFPPSSLCSCHSTASLAAHSAFWKAISPRPRGNTTLSSYKKYFFFLSFSALGCRTSKECVQLSKHLLMLHK